MSIAYFDMDKTLTRVISSVFLARMLERGKEGNRLERLLSTGRITDEEFTVRMGGLANGTSLYHLRAIYARMPVMVGIKDTVDLLHDKGVKSAIVTSGVGEFARFMCMDYGFDFYHANSTRFSETEADESEDGVDRRRVESFGPPFVTAEGKAGYVRELCEQEKADPKKCFAVGDSLGDKPMWDAVGTSIAINCNDGMSRHADYHLRHCANLVEVMPIIYKKLKTG